MSRDAGPTQRRIDQFFSEPGARADDWRDLVDAAKAWARGGDRGKYDAALADLSVTEEFHGYPGLQLMGALREAAATGDGATSLALATRITQALATRSFRQHAGDWGAKDEDEGDGDVPELVPPTFGAHTTRRPLVSSSASAAAKVFSCSAAEISVHGLRHERRVASSFSSVARKSARKCRQRLVA